MPFPVIFRVEKPDGKLFREFPATLNVRGAAGFATELPAYLPTGQYTDGKHAFTVAPAGRLRPAGALAASVRALVGAPDYRDTAHAGQVNAATAPFTGSWTALPPTSGCRSRANAPAAACFTGSWTTSWWPLSPLRSPPAGRWRAAGTRSSAAPPPAAPPLPRSGWSEPGENKNRVSRGGAEIAESMWLYPGLHLLGL